MDQKLWILEIIDRKEIKLSVLEKNGFVKIGGNETLIIGERVLNKSSTLDKTKIPFH